MVLVLVFGIGYIGFFEEVWGVLKYLHHFLGNWHHHINYIGITLLQGSLLIGEGYGGTDFVLAFREYLGSYSTLL